MLTATPIVFICDDDYAMPTCVAIQSIIDNKAPESVYEVVIVTSGLTAENATLLAGMATETVALRVLAVSTDHLVGLHVSSPNSFCVATSAALLKFEIPLLLAQYDRALYLDGDVVVRGDLSELLGSDVEGYLAGVVSDSGQIYFKHAFVKQVENYFNSGVMLLNLDLMRQLNVTEVLTERKQELQDSSLMDQNVLNIVFDGRVKYLPVRYNLLYVNLLRAIGKYTIDDINQLYGTTYSDLDGLNADAAIVHYSSKDKPWKYSDAPLADEWYGYYLRSPLGGRPLVRDTLRPAVSVVIPVYNTERYLAECLNSVIAQTLGKIEIICVDDGSTDGSRAVMKDYARRDRRVRLLTQQNSGQSVARNAGIRAARGEYVYFLDSDDFIEPGALELLYSEAVRERLDVIYFDGDSFFESSDLEAKHVGYKTSYQSEGVYNGVWNGRRLFAKMVPNGDYRPSPCLQFIRLDHLRETGVTFCDGIIHEDNLFTLQCILQAKRVGHVKTALFHRRVREHSTMTSNEGLENFVGYLICTSKMIDFTRTLSLESDELDAAYRQVAGMYTRALSVLIGLPHVTRAQIEWPVGSTEDLVHRVMHSQFVAIKGMRNEKDGLESALREANRKLTASEARIAKLRTSWSFRTGKAVTYVPRKLKALMLNGLQAPSKGADTISARQGDSSGRTTGKTADGPPPGGDSVAASLQPVDPISRSKLLLKRILPAPMSYLDRKFASVNRRLEADRGRTRLITERIQEQTALIKTASGGIQSSLDCLDQSLAGKLEGHAGCILTIKSEMQEAIVDLDRRLGAIGASVDRAGSIASEGFTDTTTAIDSFASRIDGGLHLTASIHDQLAEMRADLQRDRERMLHTEKLLSESMRVSSEILWAEVFNSTTAESEWLLDRSLSPGRWAVGYPFLYVLYRILNETEPQSILELGLGQSTKMIAQYVRGSESARHLVVEHDPGWMSFFQRGHNLTDRTDVFLRPVVEGPFLDDEVLMYEGFTEVIADRKFGLISIDGPFGYMAKKYSRVDIVNVLPDCLETSFAILVDDFDRQPERNTVELIKAKLDEESIAYRVQVYSGQKQVCVIASEDYGFLCSM